MFAHFSHVCIFLACSCVPTVELCAMYDLVRSFAYSKICNTFMILAQVPFFEQYAPGTTALFRKVTAQFLLFKCNNSNVQNLQDYTQGFDCYISGDWQSANRIFGKCKKQKPGDLHVERLLKFMVSSHAH